MLQLDNQTPFQAAIAVLPDRTGVDTLYVAIKATLALRPTLALAPVQQPLDLADAYYADPEFSSLRSISELHIGKTGTDVLLVGSAWAPEGRAVERMRVGLAVAERRKTLQVTGDRVWHDGAPTRPAPFQSMPLVWERAFGGVHRDGERVFAEERNPVGCGFAGPRSAEAMHGLPVPNLEDPAALLEETGQQVTPACMAPVAPSWLPRRHFAGTYDATWQRTRAPYLPDDFDQRFLQCAATELTFDRYLEGGERVEAVGVLPDGPLAFSLPPAHLQIDVTMAGSLHRPPAHLETLKIEPDENRACFTWRAALACDRKALQVSRILVQRVPNRGRA